MLTMLAVLAGFIGIAIIGFVIWILGDVVWEVLMGLCVVVLLVILCYLFGVVILDITGLIPLSEFGF